MKNKHPYKPHKKCKYPFTKDNINYCWGWADAVDRKNKAEYIKNCCQDCEFYEG